MALRTIADLPALDVQKIVREDKTENLAESLFEISYMEDFGQYNTYKSKYVKFRDLSGFIVDGLVSGDLDFYGRKTFYGRTDISGGMHLTGDVIVNNGPGDRDGRNVAVNADDVGFSSRDFQLSTESFAAYIDRGELRDYGSGGAVLDWNEYEVNVRAQLNAGDISCSDISVGGNAVFAGNARFSNVIEGCALCAQQADLAEFYRADADYPPGTLVMFGGTAEITLANGFANAVVTDKPGLILNGRGAMDGIYKGIALAGRTPVRVSGPVRRFDRLAPDPDRPGLAKVLRDRALPAIAVALEGSNTEGESLVECAVRLEL